MVKLFSPFQIRELVIPNRVMMSPMCQYSAQDGFVNDWHFVHYGARAVGKVGIITLEATAISPEGRITPYDLGLWKDEHIPPLKKITDFLIQQGSVPAIQLAHAGRKASSKAPWDGGLPILPEQGGWETIAPSSIPFCKEGPAPKELSLEEIKNIKDQFVNSAKRALEAGFKIAEIHSAHGYLLHEFLSPLSNQRKDEYGGTLENRQRFLIEIAELVRAVWPDNWPVFVRISATDWVNNGWNTNDTVATAKILANLGIDLIDVSSGGNICKLTLPESTGFQVPFSESIKNEVNILTSAVGLITSSEYANEIIEAKKTDIVALGRELLRNPYWVLNESKKFVTSVKWPDQYARAK